MNAPAPILSSMKKDGSRIMIRTADVRGRWTTLRRRVFAVLILFYLLAPLVPVNGKPMLQLDIEHRKFYLFGGTFNAQDFWMVLLIGLVVGFTILLVTAWHGRVFCGFVCPQSVFLEGVFRPIERFFEGPREKRIKLDAAPWTMSKILRRGGKFLTYLVLSSVLAHSFGAVFASTHGIWVMITEGPSKSPQAFIVVTFLTVVSMFYFTWFREQWCVVVCPYGRMQSVLHDRDSLAVSYDSDRGEPRGKLVRNAPEGTKRGDCVDCKRCIQVCPTGIDIRNGLQMECLACNQCIDACDEVMVKLGKPTGLIRFMSEHEHKHDKVRLWRPRLFLYIAIILIAGGTLVGSLATRKPFEANIWRARGSNPFVLDGDVIRNPFQIHVFNKNSVTGKFHVTVRSPVPADIVIGQSEFELASLTDTFVPATVSIDRQNLANPVTYEVTVSDEVAGESKTLQVGFLKPFGFGPK